jgi:hypothetical protein
MIGKGFATTGALDAAGGALIVLGGVGAGAFDTALALGADCESRGRVQEASSNATSGSSNARIAS